MTELIEKYYDDTCVYDEFIGYMNHVIYIYDRVPFLKYIREITYDKNGQVKEVALITREEMEDYIKDCRWACLCE